MKSLLAIRLYNCLLYSSSIIPVLREAKKRTPMQAPLPYCCNSPSHTIRYQKETCLASSSRLQGTSVKSPTTSCSSHLCACSSSVSNVRYVNGYRGPMSPRLVWPRLLHVLSQIRCNFNTPSQATVATPPCSKSFFSTPRTAPLRMKLQFHQSHTRSRSLRRYLELTSSSISALHFRTLSCSLGS